MCGIYPSNNSGVGNILTSFFVGLVAYCKWVSVEDFSIVIELIFGDDPAFERLGDRVLLINDFDRDGSFGAMARREQTDVLSPIFGAV